MPNFFRRLFSQVPPVNSALEAIHEDQAATRLALVAQLLGVKPKALQQALSIAGLKMVRK